MIDQKSADKYKSQVATPLTKVNIGKFVLLGVGLLLLLVSTIFAIKQSRRKKDKEVKC
jgi:hypothetical protein